MIINHNISALNTYRQLTNVNNATQKSLEKLSSGLRINRAGDDAAGLAISEKMRGQIRGLQMASKNAQDGISLIQTAEGALNETHSILQRMRELAVQAANDTNTMADRAEIQKEIDQLAKEVTRIANNTEFNTKKLLNGEFEGAVFHIGANQDQNITLSINAMDAYTLEVTRDVTEITGTPASGSQISNVQIDTTKINPDSTGIVDGAVITFSGAENTGANAVGTLNTGGTTGTITADFGEVGEAGNGIKIVFGEDSNDTVAATWDAIERTVTITADWDDSSTAAPTLQEIQDEIQSADPLLGNLTLTVSDTFTPSELENAGTITLDGGADANDAETIITVSDGTNTQNVIVADDATSVEITSGAFAGLSFEVDDVTILNSTTDSITISVSTSVSTTEEVAGGIDVSTQEAANKAITTIQNAIELVSAERSKLGAYQNRLEHTIANLGTAAENLTAAESRIRDVDMAKEIMEFTKNNIISQAAAAMLAQANAQPQLVLQLLR